MGHIITELSEIQLTFTYAIALSFFNYSADVSFMQQRGLENYTLCAVSKKVFQSISSQISNV